jgi:hypothetical protein
LPRPTGGAEFCAPFTPGLYAPVYPLVGFPNPMEVPLLEPICGTFGGAFRGGELPNAGLCTPRKGVEDVGVFCVLVCESTLGPEAVDSGSF